MLQETKLYNQGKVKLPDFIIFEKLRKYAGGGGLMTAVHENLNPILIEEDDEETEILIVDIKYKNISIRTINCYGPQEYVRKKANNDAENEENKTKEENRKFFLKLQTEIQNAKNTDNLICIQMDANSKFGKEIIKEDPCEKISENGKLLYEMINSENLVLVNSTDKCEGTITRYRKTRKTTEKSVLDYFIICRRLFEMLKKMKIDEERSLVLTKYSTRKGEKVLVESDHNPMWCIFELEWSTFIKSEKVTIFNYRDKESQEAFKEYNDKNEKLISYVKESKDIVSGGRKWFGELKDSINKSFKKIRISKERKDKALLHLLDQKVQLNKEIKILKNMKICLNMKELQDKLLSVESRIANYSSARNVKILSSHIEDLSEKQWKIQHYKNVETEEKTLP